MRSRARSGRWGAAALAGMLCIAVAGCGYDDYRTRAYDAATEALPANVTSAVACVTQAAPQMLADPSAPSLTDQLFDCAGTTILNQEVSATFPTDGVHSRHGTAAVTGVVTGGELELTFYTEGGGFAEAGISSARVSLATCWRISFDENDPHQPKDISGLSCGEGLISQTNPTEVVPFADLDLTQH